MKTIENIKGIDIYILDQIMKDRFSPTHKILDAGCGKGRNVHWFIQQGFNVYGIDSKVERIESLQKRYPNLCNRFQTTDIESCELANGSFDHIICNAVLHFASSTEHFFNMLSRLIALCKPDGQIFIRMTSDIGIENNVVELADGVYEIPDGSRRFLLTKDLIQTIKGEYPISFIEPLKTVNVDEIRCMSTLVLKKIG